VAKLAEAIISIRPNFAEAILAGDKTVELRRKIPPIVPGTRLWIYATKPVGAVVGSASVDGLIKGTPDEIWDRCGGQAGINREAFDAYFDGTQSAIALTLIDVRRGCPVSIEKLRSVRTGFHPPQVIARITETEALSLKELSGYNRSRGSAQIKRA
jgi:predicted transcriptional regulator